MSSQRYLTLDEAAKYTHLTGEELRSFVASGKIAAVVRDAGPIFDRNDLQRFMRSLKTIPPCSAGSVQRQIEEERKRRSQL